MIAEQDLQVGLLLKNRILTGTGQSIRKIILYGSRAQGTARPDSDFDVLVVEADPVVKRDERRRLRTSLAGVPYAVDVWVMGEVEIRGNQKRHRGLGLSGA